MRYLPPLLEKNETSETAKQVRKIKGLTVEIGPGESETSETLDSDVSDVSDRLVRKETPNSLTGRKCFAVLDVSGD